MSIKFVEIDRTNYNECIELIISDEQKKFVAPNIYSLVQSAYEPNFYPLGIYSEDKMVGFILYDFDEDLNGWSMSRLMIDHSFQNQGLGMAALQKFLAFFKDKYPNELLYTSSETQNNVAIRLYENAGFKKLEIKEYEVHGEHYKEIRMCIKL